MHGVCRIVCNAVPPGRHVHAGIQDLHGDLPGVHYFCAGGRAYHRISMQAPSADARPVFLQLLIYDDHELQDRMAMKVAEGCDAGVMAELQDMLRACNPYVQMFKHVKEVVKTQDVNLCFVGRTGKGVRDHGRGYV